MDFWPFFDRIHEYLEWLGTVNGTDTNEIVSNHYIARYTHREHSHHKKHHEGSQKYYRSIKYGMYITILIIVILLLGFFVQSGRLTLAWAIILFIPMFVAAIVINSITWGIIGHVIKQILDDRYIKRIELERGKSGTPQISSERLEEIHRETYNSSPLIGGILLYCEIVIK